MIYFKVIMIPKLNQDYINDMFLIQPKINL